MHLSDFTYLERCTIYVYALAYFFYSIWKSDGFQCLQPRKIFSGELKSVLTILMMLTMTTQVVWDITFTFIKYKEGYMVLENNETIIKPYQYWSPQNQQLALTANYVEAVAYSLQTSLYFMLQCFWNYLSNTVAKKDFMSSFEFKFYILWSALSMAMFPVLQWYYHYDPIFEEVIPQFAYAGEVLITALLGIRTYFRFRRIILHGQQTNANAMVINKLKYFMDINSLMTMCLFSYSLSFIIMCIDGMTETKVIATSKFAIDCILANINITCLFLYILFIAVFHPRKLYGTSNAVTNPSSNDDQPDNKNIETKESFSLPPSRERMSTHKRLSERVTSFIGQKFQHRMMDAPTTSFQQTFQNVDNDPDTMMMKMMARDSATTTTTTTTTDKLTSPPTTTSLSSTPLSFRHHHIDDDRHVNKTFMRPMSPISMDYRSSSIIMGDTEPLTAAPPFAPSPSSYLHQQQQHYQQSSYGFDIGQHQYIHNDDSNDHSDWLRRSPERRNH
ncbi:unnamed protein product [Absidia cylindrospora]